LEGISVVPFSFTTRGIKIPSMVRGTIFLLPASFVLLLPQFRLFSSVLKMPNSSSGYLPEAYEEGSLGYVLVSEWDELEIQFLLFLMEVAMDKRKIEWEHTRLNWKEHVEKLIHEGERCSRL
jgi:hypothetical protein